MARLRVGPAVDQSSAAGRYEAVQHGSGQREAGQHGLRIRCRCAQARVRYNPSAAQLRVWVGAGVVARRWVDFWGEVGHLRTWQGVRGRFGAARRLVAWPRSLAGGAVRTTTDPSRHEFDRARPKKPGRSGPDHDGPE
ncbi:hypothetical protein Ahu01nite_021590 [Winogradskya humida]|uniref:Helix-turn-helix protein n=1 Tax=Winogradskya humida TaxID=113566 RepID=A0ABQ3ZLJ1_9ACTN|nr:hypothetical protein Ahu01nite_021590 [Actinoplanes humidus]